MHGAVCSADSRLGRPHSLPIIHQSFTIPSRLFGINILIACATSYAESIWNSINADVAHWCIGALAATPFVTTKPILLARTISITGLPFKTQS